jgi:2-polyprenyl-3-methyl-5-hydroxy-6-metoxy-1,4-benzoquinol methylase
MTVSDEEKNVHIRYDNVVPKGYHLVVANKVNQYAPSHGKVLDIGCGLGQILHRVHELNPTLELFAADIFQECLRITSERVGNVRTILMKRDGFDRAGLGEGYDVCVMSHSLEHMKSPLEALHNVMSVIRPGGHLILAVPNPVRPQVIICNLSRSRYVNLGHVYSWDRAHWMNFLENIAGFNVVEYPVDEVQIFPPRISRRFHLLKQLEKGLSYAFPWFSFSNIAVIRK